MLEERRRQLVVLRVGGVGVDRDGAGAQRLDAARETLGLGLESTFGLLAQALRTRGDDYREYQRTTPMLIPWFPKTGRHAPDTTKDSE